MIAENITPCCQICPTVDYAKEQLAAELARQNMSVLHSGGSILNSPIPFNHPLIIGGACAIVILILIICACCVHLHTLKKKEMVG